PGRLIKHTNSFSHHFCLHLAPIGPEYYDEELGWCYRIYLHCPQPSSLHWGSPFENGPIIHTQSVHSSIINTSPVVFFHTCCMGK
ncbi:hypothetical protein HAX54_007486, partial [Datura stramonium]|nr:hypothetical protein [Datura stramonium]